MDTQTNTKKYFIFVTLFITTVLIVSRVLPSSLTLSAYGTTIKSLGWFWSQSAAVMSSLNHKIVADSINSSGIEGAGSGNYALSDTLGELATGLSSSTNYNLAAGYRQMVPTYLSLSVPATVSMPNISGLAGGTSLATSTVTVVTDDPGGYMLTIQASTTPAMRSGSGASFTDYTPAGSNPDYTFTTASTLSNFGFAVSGTDTAAHYKNNGSTCGTGSLITLNRCWDGFSTTTKTIAQGANNQPNGATTTISFQAGIGSSKIQDAGSYSATITVTAVAL